MKAMSKELTEVYHSHPIVYSTLRNGGSMEDCVVALAKQNEALMKRIFHLYSRVPANWEGMFNIEDEDAHLSS